MQRRPRHLDPHRVPSVTSMLRTALPVTLELSLLAIAIATRHRRGRRRASPRCGAGARPSGLANALALLGLSVPQLLARPDRDPVPVRGDRAVPGLGVRAAARATRWATCTTSSCPRSILGTGLAAVIMRQTRSSMLEALSTDYVRTARAKGLRRGGGDRPARAAQQPDRRRHHRRAPARRRSSPAPSSPSRSSGCPASGR